MTPVPITADPCAPAAPLAVDAAQLPRVAVVVPCHNEAEGLVQLATKLQRLRAATARHYRLETVLVDDGSTDETWSMMQDLFGEQSDVTLVRHETNRGIAAAIATGLQTCRPEVVASLDADCTYDPLELVPMLALLTDGVDLVVASPYHPRGGVEGVPAWRLALSQCASRLYRLVLQNKLHTYTSCVRVYRRSSVVDLPLANTGFVGVVELVWQLDRRGGRIVEHPATLSVRRTGVSKMRVLRTAWAHLKLLARAGWLRLFAPQPPPIHRLQPLRTAA